MKALKAKVSTFPTTPGVYLMKDARGQVLYVGKAKSLRDRVRSYLGTGDGRRQISFLMERVEDIECILCENENQAVILERDLIVFHKPRYNIRLKDDKSYLRVKINQSSEWPRLQLVRREYDDGARYFGPFLGSQQLKQVLDVIKRVLPLRTCTDSVFHNRQRPCLEYQIKRCSGPCCLPVDQDDYYKWVQQAQNILEGKTDEVLQALTEKMEIASNELRFEEAASLRDRITILERFSQGHQYVFYRGESKDVFFLYREEQSAVLNILSTRGGRISESKNFHFEELLIDSDQVLTSAIEQFYQQGHQIPQEILVPMELENNELLVSQLRDIKGTALSISVPVRGPRVRLLELARLNAEQYFSTVFHADVLYEQTAMTISETCQLSMIPRRVECIDISNLQGTHISGGLVVFFDGKPLKKEYRKYKIRMKDTQDDFLAIYEVTLRRLQRGIETGELPDLLVIDGGKGQLSMALRAREELQVDVDIISLAKMRTNRTTGAKSPERIFTEWNDEALPLESGKPETLFLQRIRDEVHNYVIGYHRKRRNRAQLKSVLDDIPGIGYERKRRILSSFKTAQEIIDAPVEALAKAGRMSPLLAKKVISVLRDSQEHNHGNNSASASSASSSQP